MTTEKPKTAGEAARLASISKPYLIDLWERIAQAAIDFHLNNTPCDWVLCDREQAEEWYSGLNNWIKGNPASATIYLYRRRAPKLADVEKLKAEVERLNQALDQYSEREILGETERCKYDAEIVRLKLELEKHQWIKCSDRLPTKEDADKFGCVLWHNDDWATSDNWNDPGKSTHWKPTNLPQIDTERQRFESAWQQQLAVSCTGYPSIEAKEIAWKAWQARGKGAV